MEEPDFSIFSALYREAYLQCLKQPLSNPLTETESKLFYQQILDRTGLTVGWRSLKNYSFFVLGTAREENPSVASMDTIARYVLGAPYTNDIDRKNHESHHPYWFRYREMHLARVSVQLPKRGKSREILAVMAIVALLSALVIWYNRSVHTNVIENFTDLSENGIRNRGWQVINKDNYYWAKRSIKPGVLALFTLDGDNWPDGKTKPGIKNLLLRPLEERCFTAELDLQDFVPEGEWQQAGLLLLRDSTLSSPTIRLSLAFNDLFGGYKKGNEILVQAISSSGLTDKPEEFVHAPVLTSDSTAQRDTLLTKNLAYSALRIEKNGKQFRFLYAGGAVNNAAFRQLAIKEFSFEPRYIGIFAIKGQGTKSEVKAVIVKTFLLKYTNCE
ncbi:hypothetical protein [Mucilaginibacter sp.]|uniref:hypothetical protein n=1 Tax=Mucilaginibacter sp. TaxID=1882438 RepID=UPI0035BBB6BD